MDGRACVYVSVFLSVCLSICPSEKLNYFWWNEVIMIKILGTFQLHTSNFLEEVSDQPASRTHPWVENSLFLENLSPPLVLVLQGCDIPF
jgi:hypothetical protein